MSFICCESSVLEANTQIKNRKRKKILEIAETNGIKEQTTSRAAFIVTCKSPNKSKRKQQNSYAQKISKKSIKNLAVHQ